jgi:hypothetical protein
VVYGKRIRSSTVETFTDNVAEFMNIAIHCKRTDDQATYGMNTFFISDGC